MNIRYPALAGGVLILAGLLLMAHPEFRRHVETRQIQVADQDTTLETAEIFTFPRIVSALMVIFGVALLVAPRRPEPTRVRRALKPRR